MADFMRSSVHCHSTLCDGKNTLQEMASAACAQGLTTLGFTGHSHTPCDREYCMSPRRTALYKATIAKLKAEYKGKVISSAALSGISSRTTSGPGTTIGSAACITCTAQTPANTTRSTSASRTSRPASPTISAGTAWAAAEAYFRSVAEVAALGPDILGHIDLIKKLNRDGDFFDENAPATVRPPWARWKPPTPRAACWK